MNDHKKETCILSFLTALNENNSLEWMHSHKDFQKEASAQFQELLQEIIGDLALTDPALAHLKAGDLVFKLNRDTPFSHDKSPYNPSFRAHISPAGRLPVPVGYYLHISPGHTFLGGGLYASMFKDATSRLRDYLQANGEEFLDIINTPEFQDSFVLTGEKLKNVPRGYDDSLPQSEYLKYKCIAIEHFVDDSMLSDVDSFRDYAVRKFLDMRDFNGYINRALDGFVMPSR